MLEKYNEFWNKVRDSIKKEFYSEPVCIEKHLKTKKKSYEEKINTDFYGDKVLKDGSQCIFLSVILTNIVTSNIVFLEQVKSIILKCFWKNVNVLLKKKDA